MGAIKVILLVVFIIISILLILLVLVQNDQGDGMGGMFSGAGTAAFGSHSGSVIHKTTFVLVALFFVTAFSIARLNRKAVVKPDLAPSIEAEKTETADAADKDFDWVHYLNENEKPAATDSTVTEPAQ